MRREDAVRVPVEVLAGPVVAHGGTRGSAVRAAIWTGRRSTPAPSIVVTKVRRRRDAGAVGASNHGQPPGDRVGLTGHGVDRAGQPLWTTNWLTTARGRSMLNRVLESDAGLSQVFAALADPTRRDLVALAAVRPGCTRTADVTTHCWNSAAASAVNLPPMLSPSGVNRPTRSSGVCNARSGEAERTP